MQAQKVIWPLRCTVCCDLSSTEEDLNCQVCKDEADGSCGTPEENGESQPCSLEEGYVTCVYFQQGTYYSRLFDCFAK